MNFIFIFSVLKRADPHAVDQFLGQTPFDILTSNDYESDVNTIFGCTLEVSI